MKSNKFYIILVVAVLASVYYLMSIPDNAKKEANTKETKTQKIRTDGNILSDVTDKKMEMPQDHSKAAIDCKSCHACEYPTKNDPCLIACPRTDMISVHHTPDEGPVVVTMKDIKGKYGDVVFSHKLHAEMSEMTGGCNGCHHYNTTGPVLKCKTCHSVDRIRDDLQTPDLESAYHRQCLSCHRQWSRKTDCQNCHISNEDDAGKKAKSMEEAHKLRSHPPLNQPMKVVYETSYEKGKFATFFHDEHTRLFGATCVDCHKDENCMKCHDVKLKELRGNERPDLKIKTHKTFEDHHRPCIDCHQKNECAKCHSDKPMDSFNHLKISGFDISRNHSNLKCGKCHKESGNFKGLNSNCTSCHGDFKTGKFNHGKVGLTLDEMHVDLECTDCHKDAKFAKTPVCSDCHDDKSFPKNLPGKLIKK